MRVLDILNLKPRKLNHHDEVYSQGKKHEAARRWQGREGSGITAAVDGKPASSAAAIVDDRASRVVD